MVMLTVALGWLASIVGVLAAVLRTFDVATRDVRYRVTTLPKVYTYTVSDVPARPEKPIVLRPQNRHQERKAPAVAKRLTARGDRVVIAPRQRGKR